MRVLITHHAGTHNITAHTTDRLCVSISHDLYIVLFFQMTSDPDAKKKLIDRYHSFYRLISSLTSHPNVHNGWDDVIKMCLLIVNSHGEIGTHICYHIFTTATLYLYPHRNCCISHGVCFPDTLYVCDVMEQVQVCRFYAYYKHLILIQTDDIVLYYKRLF